MDAKQKVNDRRNRGEALLIAVLVAPFCLVFTVLFAGLLGSF